MAIRIDDDGLVACVVLEGPRAFGLVTGNGEFIDPENEARAQRHGEVHAIGTNAEAAEHLAQRDRAKFGKKVDQVVPVHCHGPIFQPSIFAGVS